MANRIRWIEDATSAGRRLQSELGLELREARVARGLRQIDVARAANKSIAQISRIEHGMTSSLGVIDLSRHGAAVGLKLHARFYPTGAGLRDAAQLDLIRRLRLRVGNRWRWQLEAPLNIPGDLRAFDALLTNGDERVAIEAITRLRDAQAQLRAAALKQRDGQVSRLVVVVRATHHNRTALRSAAEVLATTFPLSTRATLATLAAGEDPGENGIVLL